MIDDVSWITAFCNNFFDFFNLILHFWNGKIKSMKPFLWVEQTFRVCTDLGSLIGNFDRGYSSDWKFSNFPATLILCEINLGWFQKGKNCNFNNFWGFELWLLEKCYTWKFPKFPKIRFQTSKLINFLKSAKIDFT